MPVSGQGHSEEDAANEEGKNPFLVQDGLDGIGELDLPAPALGPLLQVVENARGEDVAPHHSQIGGRIFGLGFFHNIDDADMAIKLYKAHKDRNDPSADYIEER